MQTIVEVKNLSKYYGKNKVLSDVSLEVYEKEIIGLIGPNGAGKSTLMKCMTSLVFFQEGEIRICGYDIHKQREKALSMQSSLIENPGMYPDMTGEENLKFFAKFRKTSKEHYEYVKEFTGLGIALQKKTREYSLGMKQRLGLGIALLSEPRFLILDEPMNGLDPDGVMILRENLRNLAMHKNISILISSHQLGEIEKIATRIICINHGSIVKTEEMVTEKKQYILETSETEKLMQILNGCSDLSSFQQLKSGHIIVEFDNNNGLQKLLAEAQCSGVVITDVERKSINIEDLYCQVFGGES